MSDWINFLPQPEKLMVQICYLFCFLVAELSNRRTMWVVQPNILAI